MRRPTQSQVDQLRTRTAPKLDMPIVITTLDETFQFRGITYPMDRLNEIEATGNFIKNVPSIIEIELRD